MRNFIFFAICIVLIFFQLSVLGIFFAGQRLPDIALALVVTLTILLGFKDALKWTILAGVVMDAGTSWIFGTGILALVIVSWLVELLGETADIKPRKKMFFVFFAGLVAAAKIVSDILAAVFQKGEGYWLHSGLNASVSFLSWDYALRLLFTILAGIFVYYFINRTRRFLFDPSAVVKIK